MPKFPAPKSVMLEMLKLLLIAGVPVPLKFTKAFTYCVPPPPEIAVVLASVILPIESTVSTGMAELLPYVPGVTPLADNCAVERAPEVILLALVVSVMADAASPLT